MYTLVDQRPLRSTNATVTESTQDTDQMTTIT